MNKSDTFKQCQGCKFNIPFNESESVCQRQEMMLKAKVEPKEESCNDKQERVYEAC